MIVLLASTLLVAGAMAGRGISPRRASGAALAISVGIAALTAWYYRLHVDHSVSASYGWYLGAVAAAVAIGCSLWALLDAVRAVRAVRASGARGDPVSRFVTPITLTGPRWVRVEPLSTEHIPEIGAAAEDSDNRSLWFTFAPAPESAGQWVHRMLDMQAGDDGVTFVVRRLDDGRVVGSTSMFHVDAPNRRLEIGHTWYSRSAQRTGVNSETKLVLLGHAFDTLGCIAVEFRTHFFNSASREAIERLGAKLDGVLRSHQTLARRVSARHRGVFDPRHRMAGRAVQSAVPFGPLRLDDADARSA